MNIPNLPLEGKVAIVTGGGSGIGQGIVLEFARAGADVVVAGRRLSVLEKVGEEVRGFGRRSLAVQADVSQKADVNNLVQRVMDEFGVIDILVNSAGIVPTKGPLIDMPEDEWDRVIDIDLKGYHLCCQAVAKRMIERKSGNIISLSSYAGLKANPEYGAYCIAKAGVIMLTRVLARELARYNIRVNAIAPGSINVERNKSLWGDPEHLKQREAGIPLGRAGQPSDIASVALFLASDASRWVTGDTILVDGGVLA